LLTMLYREVSMFVVRKQKLYIYTPTRFPTTRRSSRGGACE
jgi:hypothetical protein